MTNGPEDSFDWQDSGETPVDWSSDLDFGAGDLDIDPIYLGRVDLFPDDPGNLFANVYTEPGFNYDPLSVEFGQLEDLLNIPDARDRAEFYGNLQDASALDMDSPDVRGPFPDRETVEDWLRETGLEEFSEVYYDSETDQYFIEIIGSE